MFSRFWLRSAPFGILFFLFLGPITPEAEPASEVVEPPPSPVSIDPPAAPGATAPAVASESVTTLRQQDDVLMTWFEPGASSGRLKFARWIEGDWTPPITIADGVSTLGPADRPSLTVLDTQAVRRTLIARTGNVVARSGDAGRTWTRLPAPTLPFASFAGGDEGGFAFWLKPGDDGAAQLVGTRILAGETLIDSRAADSSNTSAAMTWDGPIVVYRDQSVEDVVIVRRQDARWTRPRPVHHVAGWRPPRRPKSGPEVAVWRRQVAVAWYAEAPHRPRVLVAFSSDAGRTFDVPIEVEVKEGERTPLAAVDVTMGNDGHAVVLWLAASRREEASLNLARISPTGERGTDLIVAEGLDPESEALPQIVSADGRVAVTWVESTSAPGRPAGIRARSVPLASLAAPGHPEPAVAAVAEDQAVVRSRRGRVGEPMPDFHLKSLDGEPVSRATFDGQPALINLWATWCLPCIAEMPELLALQKRYGPQGLMMVGLSVDDADSIGRVREFIAQHRLSFPIWLDPGMSVFSAVRVKSLPVTLILDRQGQIVFRQDGRIRADDEELVAALEKVLDADS